MPVGRFADGTAKIIHLPGYVIQNLGRIPTFCQAWLMVFYRLAHVVRFKVNQRARCSTLHSVAPRSAKLPCRQRIAKLPQFAQ